LLQHVTEIGCRVTALLAGTVKKPHVRDGPDAELLHHRRAPIFDVNFEQNHVRFVLGQLFQARANLRAGTTPLRIEIHNRDLALGQKLGQIHLLASIRNDPYFLNLRRGGFGSSGILLGGSFRRGFIRRLDSGDKLRIELGQPHWFILLDFEDGALLVELDPPFGVKPQGALGSLEFAGRFA